MGAARGGARVQVGPDDSSGRAPHRLTAQLSRRISVAFRSRHEAVVAMQAEIDAAGIPLRLRTGAEVALTRAADLDDEELRRLRLGGGEWLLAEFPLSMAAPGLDRLMHRLRDQGHRVLIAHPERAPEFHRSPDVLRRLVEAGMLTQITAGSLVGRFGSTAPPPALRCRPPRLT